MNKLCNYRCCDDFDQSESQQYIENYQFKNLYRSQKNLHSSSSFRTSLKDVSTNRSSRRSLALNFNQDLQPDRMVRSNFQLVTESNLPINHGYSIAKPMSVIQPVYTQTVFVERPIYHQVQSAAQPLNLKNSGFRHSYQGINNGKQQYNNVILQNRNKQVCRSSLTYPINQMGVRHQSPQNRPLNVIYQQTRPQIKSMAMNQGAFGKAKLSTLPKIMQQKLSSKLNSNMSTKDLQLGNSIATVKSEVDQQPSLADLKLVRKDESEIVIDFFHPSNSQLDGWKKSKKNSSNGNKNKTPY